MRGNENGVRREEAGTTKLHWVLAKQNRNIKTEYRNKTNQQTQPLWQQQNTHNLHTCFFFVSRLLRTSSLPLSLQLYCFSILYLELLQKLSVETEEKQQQWNGKDKKTLRTAQVLSDILSKMKNKWVIANISMHTFPFFILAIGDFLLELFSGEIFAQSSIMNKQFFIKCVSLCVVCTFYVLIQLLSHLEVVQIPYTVFICRNCDIIDSYLDTIEVTMTATCITCIVTSDKRETRAQTNKKIYVYHFVYRCQCIGLPLSWSLVHRRRAYTFTWSTCEWRCLREIPTKTRTQKEYKGNQIRKKSNKLRAKQIAQIQLHRRLVWFNWIGTTSMWQWPYRCRTKIFCSFQIIN